MVFYLFKSLLDCQPLQIAAGDTAVGSTTIATGAAPLHAQAQKPLGQVVAYVRSLEGTLVELCSPVAG